MERNRLVWNVLLVVAVIAAASRIPQLAGTIFGSTVDAEIDPSYL